MLLYVLYFSNFFPLAGFRYIRSIAITYYTSFTASLYIFSWKLIIKACHPSWVTRTCYFNTDARTYKGTSWSLLHLWLLSRQYHSQSIPPPLLLPTTSLESCTTSISIQVSLPREVLTVPYYIQDPLSHQYHHHLILPSDSPSPLCVLSPACLPSSSQTVQTI